jgi:hypothetical protein
MMVVTAVVAVWLWVLFTCHRHAEYQKLLNIHIDGLRRAEGIVTVNEPRVDLLRRRGIRDPRATAEATVTTEMLKYMRQLAVYHEQMKQEYASARWHPWSAVDPDPPEPVPSKELIKLVRELQVTKRNQ